MSTTGAPLLRAKTLPASPVLRERDERLESLKFLMGKLVHDFNNFLVPLLGYVGLLKEDLAPGSNGLTYAEAMENAARKTEGYLDVMLLAARPYRRFEPKPTDFKKLLESAILEWKSSLPSGAAIEIRELISPCSITLDELQWTKVFVQLLGNARFALACGGILEIGLEPQTLSSAEMLDLNISEPGVFRLTMRDSGFGMSAAVLNRACEPFFTTRIGSTATGLGLTLVHSVVQLHGGQLAIDSTENVGTTVTIWIPESFARIAASAAEGQRKASLLKPQQSSDRSKILLVENDLLLREVLKPCLQQTNRDVFLASDGEEALRIFRRFPRDWALVVSGADLPKLNGWDLCRSIRTDDAGLGVVLVASSTNLPAGAAALASEQRPSIVLTKPFALRHFKEAIQSLVAARL
jgi:CheY-like chemotaxis protein/nitrogen-specific signal transduction histidine kinase